MFRRKVLITTGEVSGDVIGSLLAAALRRRDPECLLFGLGGERMAREGVRVLMRSDDLGVIGLVEVIPVLRKVVRAFLEVRRLVLSERPQAAVLVAHEGMHLPLAWWLRRKGVGTVCFFPAQVWMWRRLLGPIGRGFDTVLASFREEEEVYRRKGAATIFCGHYLADALFPPRPDQVARLRRRFGIGGGPVVALLPGSRLQEVRELAPVVLDAAVELRRLYPRVQFLLPLADARYGPMLEEQIAIRRLGDRVRLTGKSQEALAASDLALLSSGTASLEAALLGVPMVIFYRLSPVTLVMVRCLRRLRVLTHDQIGLPNLLAGRRIVAELHQAEATAANLVREARGLLDDETRRERMRDALGAVRRELGPGEALDTAARSVLRECDRRLSVGGHAHRHGDELVAGRLQHGG